MYQALRHLARGSANGLSVVVRRVAPAVLVLSIAACVTDGSSRRAPASVSDAARHAVHSDKLARVMSRIERYRRQSWPQEVESEYESDRAAGTEQAFTQAELLASRLTEAAAQIADVVHGAEIAEADRRGFLAQVGVFESQVRQLRLATARRDADAMRRTLRQIEMTCQSCHFRFRDVAGPID